MSESIDMWLSFIKAVNLLANEGVPDTRDPAHFLRRADAFVDFARGMREVFE